MDKLALIVMVILLGGCTSLKVTHPESGLDVGYNYLLQDKNVIAEFYPDGTMKSLSFANDSDPAIRAIEQNVKLIDMISKGAVVAP